MALEALPHPALDPNPKHRQHLLGRISEIPFSIHVARPLSDGFRRLDPNSPTPAYRVRLRYGPLFEPWVTAVDFAR